MYQQVINRFEGSLPSELGPFLQNSEITNWEPKSKIDALHQKLEPKLSISPPTFIDFVVDEKVRYLKTVKSSIELVRQQFLLNIVNESIRMEKAMEKLRCCIQSREKDLKNQLRKIGEAKVIAWNKQINVIDEAVRLLQRNEKENSFDVMTNNLTTEIDFVDAGEVKFEFDDLTVFGVLQNLGRITYSNQLSSDEQGVALQNVVPKFVFGKNGEGEGEFCRPWGVFADQTGRILVADRSNHRIQIFNESGNFILQFGKKGDGPGEFLLPSGVTVDNMCRIIVADKDNHRIQVFTYSGGFLFGFGRRGSGPGEFCYPWDVAANSKCEIAVSDTKNHRVQLFDRHGCFLAKFGFGNCRAELRRLDCPRGLAFWADGSLLVTDFNNHRVLIISPDFKSTKRFSKEGAKPGQLFRPQGITCSPQGYFAVSDCKNYRIQVFDYKGNVCKTFGTEGKSPGQLDCPQGICYHPNGNLIVVDFGNSRVQVF